MEVTFLSYNVQHFKNFITQEIDFDLFAKTIGDLKAEVVGLNEVRDMGVDSDYQPQAKILAEKLGYYYYFAKAIDFGGVNPYGNAIVSKYPIKSAKVVKIPNPNPPKYDGYYEPRCVLQAELEISGRIITVLVSHFGLNPDEQENAIETVKGLFKSENCILMGDFNIDSDKQLIERVRAFACDTAVHLKGELFSFPSDKPRVKIDYIFTSHDLRVKRADIPQIVTADHCPHLAVIEI